MVLVPEVVDAVAPPPVLAAGGIANGRQLAAAMALGAQGVWTGSVWLTTEEAETHPVVKEKFLAATSAIRSVHGRRPESRRASSDRHGPTNGRIPRTRTRYRCPFTNAHRRGRERIARSAYTKGGAEKLINYFVGQVVG